jgi:hypothetical protein
VLAEVREAIEQRRRPGASRTGSRAATSAIS